MASKDHRKTAAGANHRYRRRQYLINPSFQWKYAITIGVTVFVTSSLLAFVLYGLLHNQARMRLMNPTAYRAEVTFVMLAFALGFAAVTAAAMGLWSVIVTHRVVGPLFVVDRYLGELAAGRIPKLRPLRSKDEFKALYATFSRAVESLRAGKLAEQGAMMKALNAAREAENGDDRARKEALRSVADCLEELYNASAKACGGELDLVPAARSEPSTSAEKTPVAVA